jgi:hypothetical protein
MVLKSWKANDVVASWAMNSVIVTLICVATFAHRFRDFPWIDANQPRDANLDSRMLKLGDAFLQLAIAHCHPAALPNILGPG